ncbi:MAG: response regulator [Rhodospirillales bacterium]|nr:response regulator [Rhodospirillales bacterium]
MGQAITLDRLNILVVDDNDHMRSLIRLILQSFCCNQIREASDGADALREMQAVVPDILVTNWNMAPLDGVELTRHIRNSPDSPNPFMPIIMVTAYAELYRVFAARDAGVTEFLVKPLSAKALYSRVQAVILRPRPFVRTKQFFGPDRRRHGEKPFIGKDRRGKDAPKPPPRPRDTVLEQDEINELFNPT